jgi:hypothetical protein
MTTTIGGSYPAVNSDSDATINGLTVGKGGASQSNNTALGNSALTSNNSSGNNNTGIGFASLGLNTSGGFNTALGTYSLYSNTTASNNTAVGYQAAYTSTTVSGISAFGNQALKLNTGSGNNAFGDYVLALNTTGTNNSAFGGSETIPALYSNTTGSNNSAFGVNALTSNTTGANNSAFGTSALAANTTASQNTVVGYQAGYALTTGGSNVAIGYQTLDAATTGGANTAVGNRAAGLLTTGLYNTIIGADAGAALTTGTSNCFVGATGTSASGELITTGSKNSIFGSYNGNQGGLDIRTASNYIVLSDGDGNPRQIIDGSGNVGIGVVPSANITKSLEIGYAGAGFVGDSSSLNINVTANLVNASGGWKYAASGKSALLQVGAGSGRIETYTVTASGTAGNLVTFTTGPYVANGGTSWTSASDERLKNITGEISNALNKVSQLRAAEYTWKADLDSKPQIGLIAQDLLNVLPEAVVLPENEIDEKGKQQYMGVNYDSVIPLLVKAIQELKAEVDSLKQQLGK